MKPTILTSGICVTSPQLPCCNRTKEVFTLLSGPVAIADLGYPQCRADGYFEAKQCQWGGCYCVDQNGNSVSPLTPPVDRNNVQCPGSAPVENCPTFCTMEYMPVCDSKGVTHGNKCSFEVAACEARKRNENLVIAKQGACDNTPKCRDGETKKMDCNDCRCMKGLWACTRKLCLPGVNPPVIQPITPPTPQKCPPGMRGMQPFCRPALPKPAILATGICATSPQLPCCNQTLDVYNMLNGPYEIADLSYPDCRADGYYEAKQCHWAGCVCVDKYGKADPTAPTQPPGNFNIQCPGATERITECKDGETKMTDDNCNTCVCSSGLWACTKRFCFTRDDNNNNNGFVGAGNMNTNTMNTMNTMNVATGSLARSGEACLTACKDTHAPWKAIGETDPKKEAAWKCMDKCADVTCTRKCEIVFPNRGEEWTVMKCKADRCKATERKTTMTPRGANNDKYGVKGGLRKFVTKKQNYGVKS